jgi:excisionase family DNA binding protein
MDATKKIYSVKEVAELMGVSRITVFRWIKSGKVKADMVAGSYIIRADDLPHHLLGGLSEEKKETIRKVVTQAIEEYGETFRALARE